MKVEIYGRKAMEDLIRNGFPSNAAVISFYTPPRSERPAEPPIDYRGVCERVFPVGIPDVDREILGGYGYTFESYLAEADDLAEFILDAQRQGLSIICQCDYGQSRSAACAAAILQYFEGRGIDVFADYRYYPNQLVYHKVLDALMRKG